MRLILAVLTALVAVQSPAVADQTDPRLEGLFEELRQGDANDAEAIADRIRMIWADSQSDTADVLIKRALISIDREDWTVATALLDHVIGLSPSFAEAYMMRGYIRGRTNNAAGAAEDYRAAIDREPRHFQARLSLAELYLARGDHETAHAMIQDALVWHPHNETALEMARELRSKLEGQEI